MGPDDDFPPEEGREPAVLPLLPSSARRRDLLGTLVITDRTVPRLAEGAEVLGPYRGSGLRDVPFLVRTAAGHVVQLTSLLYLLASDIDGHRDRKVLADRLSARLGRSVSAANVEYLVARKLEPLGIVARSPGPRAPGAEAAAAVSAGHSILSFRIRRAVVPERIVTALAHGLRFFFAPAIVVVTLAALTAFDVWLAGEHGIAAGVRQVVVEPVAFLAVTALVIVSGGFHELGHAAACRYGGARPGRLGVGLYVAWPVFYSDVTDSYRLSRSGRLRTDLGGLYFNALVAVAAAAAFLVTGVEALIAFVVIQQVQMAQQFLPFVRLDGYYVIADLAGVPDPFGRMKPVLASLIPRRPLARQAAELTPTARAVLAAWALAAIPVVGLNLVLLVVHGPVLFDLITTSIAALAVAAVAAAGGGEVVSAVSLGTRAVMLLLPAVGFVAVLGRLARGCVAGMRSRMRRRRATAATAGLRRPATTMSNRVPETVVISTHPALVYVTRATTGRVS